MHCGPDGIYVSALGGADGADGPGRRSPCSTTTRSRCSGRWEVDRGPQYLAYDFWWHLAHDVLVTSEWGTPSMIEDGVIAELLLGRQVRPRAALLGPAQAPPRAAGRPRRRAPDGAGAAPGARPDQDVRLRRRGDQRRGPVRLDLAVAPRRTTRWASRKVITIPAEPADAPRPAAGARAVRGGAAAGHRHRPVGRRPFPLRLLLGHRRAQALRRERPVPPGARPARCASAASSGARAHPSAPDEPLAGGPQMVEVSRDGQRVYVTQLAVRRVGRPVLPRRRRRVDGQARRPSPDGFALRRRGSSRTATSFRGLRLHQTRLQGGDASSDSYCFP